MATYDKPAQPAVGVQTVIVNGGLVVRDGALIPDAAHGQAIRREVR
jgi:N-acyl-D-glutamate deacylase